MNNMTNVKSCNIQDPIPVMPKLDLLFEQIFAKLSQIQDTSFYINEKVSRFDNLDLGNNKECESIAYNDKITGRLENVIERLNNINDALNISANTLTKLV